MSFIPSASRWRRSTICAAALALIISSANISRRPPPPAAAWWRPPGSRATRLRICRKNFDQIVQSWDTANKPTKLADYSVCTTFGVKNNHFYLLHVLRKKFGYPDLKRAVIEQSRLFAPSVILIEDKASGTQLIQELR
jgi:hypothetical protein